MVRALTYMPDSSTGSPLYPYRTGALVENWKYLTTLLKGVERADRGGSGVL